MSHTYVFICFLFEAIFSKLHRCHKRDLALVFARYVGSNIVMDNMSKCRVSRP